MATSVLSNECCLCVKTYDSYHSCDRWLSEYFFHVDDKHCLQIWSHVVVQLARQEHFHGIASSLTLNTMRSNQHQSCVIPLLISARNWGLGGILQWAPKLHDLHVLQWVMGNLQHKVKFQAIIFSVSLPSSTGQCLNAQSEVHGEIVFPVWCGRIDRTAHRPPTSAPSNPYGTNLRADWHR